MPNTASQDCTSNFPDFKPLINPGKPWGKMVVKLYPMENVMPGKPVLVTFGIPFTPGSITENDVSKVRVLKDNQEVPAYIDMLTPWRSFTDTVFNGKWVRVARIQIWYTFNTAFPRYEEILVEWGMTLRQCSKEDFSNPRKFWHKIDVDDFSCNDEIYEPDVYAVLPAEVLCNGSLRTPMIPFPKEIVESRDIPGNVIFDEHQTEDYTGYDYASKNFFYTIINQDDEKVASNNLSPYKNHYEPWLYDRSSAIYALYFRTGFFKMLREAVHSSQFYINNIDSDGYFILKGRDAKYSYIECMAYTYWLTGDDLSISKVQNIINAFDYVNTRWHPALDFWTERHPGFKLLAYSFAYELLGYQKYKKCIQGIIDDFIWHQDGAGGLIPKQRVDGGLYHYALQHDPSEVGVSLYHNLIASPWMTVLIVDAMLRCYSFTRDARIANFIKRMGCFLCAASKSDGKHGYSLPTTNGDTLELTYPDYLMGYDGVSINRSINEHNINVACALAWAAYFAKLAGTHETRFVETANALYLTYLASTKFTIRPENPGMFQYPAYYYPVGSMRKYNWLYRTSGSFSWLMEQLKPLL